MLQIKIAPKTSRPLLSRPRVINFDGDFALAQQEAARVFKSSRRAWVSVETEDTCLYLLIYGADNQHEARQRNSKGTRMAPVDFPKILPYTRPE